MIKKSEDTLFLIKKEKLKTECVEDFKKTLKSQNELRLKMKHLATNFYPGSNFESTLVENVNLLTKAGIPVEQSDADMFASFKIEHPEIKNQISNDSLNIEEVKLIMNFNEFDKFLEKMQNLRQSVSILIDKSKSFISENKQLLSVEIQNDLKFSQNTKKKPEKQMQTYRQFDKVSKENTSYFQDQKIKKEVFRLEHEITKSQIEQNSAKNVSFTEIFESFQRMNKLETEKTIENSLDCISKNKSYIRSNSSIVEDSESILHSNVESFVDKPRQNGFDFDGFGNNAKSKDVKFINSISYPRKNEEIVLNENQSINSNENSKSEEFNKNINHLFSGQRNGNRVLEIEEFEQRISQIITKVENINT